VNDRTDPARATDDTGRHLLLALGESDDSRRAVMYVADFFGGYRDLFITLLSILAEPPEDLFTTEQARAQWLQAQKRAREALLADYRRILVGAGLAEDRIAIRVTVRHWVSLGDAILEEQEQLNCCIVVVGRRGLSHHEEFLFGSTSSRILHRARRCAVMVVQ
jgi:nucleotide-binding universal stress UspA family protein